MNDWFNQFIIAVAANVVSAIIILYLYRELRGLRRSSRRKRR